MFLPKAYRAVFALLCLALTACGEPDWTPGDLPEISSSGGAIVGGWAATSAQIFATVEIRHTGASSGFCSGALISPLVVATAAHCAVVENESGSLRAAKPSSLQVVAGHLSSDSIEPDMVRQVTAVRVHEAYDHDYIMGRSRAGAGKGGIGSPNDLALLFISRPYDAIPNAPMLSRDESQELVHHGDLGFVAGYGVYDQEADLSGELHISDAIIDILGPRELLTRRADQLGDSCFGDSGGPFYLPTEYGDFLVGLVSRGRSDVRRDCGDGGVYTLLSSYLPWIAETAGARFAPRLLPETTPVAFRPEGAEIYVSPQGADLDRIHSCAASDDETNEPLAAMLLLGFVTVLQREASRRARR